MKKRSAILTGFLAFSLALSSFTGLALALASPGSARETLAVEEHFVLRTQEDTICIYQDGELLLDTGISPAGLPRQDQETLREGLTVESSDELRSLLEDFSS